MGNIETPSLELNKPRRKIFEQNTQRNRSLSPASNLDLSSNRIYLKNFKNVKYPSPILTSPLTQRTQRKISKSYVNKSIILKTQNTKLQQSTPRRYAKPHHQQISVNNIQQHKILSQIESDRIHNILYPGQFSKNLNSCQEKLQEQQNRQRCKDIIKKVRNFNDFLNEVKKRIKYQSEKYQSELQLQSRKQSQSHNHAEQNDNHNSEQILQHYQKLNTKKSLNIALKLENQRIELQKYKKLLQRELSKQNIVDNITVQSSQNDDKQKILTIKYESKNYSSKSSGKVMKKYNQVVQKVGELGKELNHLNDQSSMETSQPPSTIQQQQKMKKTIKYREVPHQKIPIQRINKIESLFQKVSEIQQQNFKNCSSIAKYLKQKKRRQSSNDQELF